MNLSRRFVCTSLVSVAIASGQANVSIHLHYPTVSSLHLTDKPLVSTRYNPLYKEVARYIMAHDHSRGNCDDESHDHDHDIPEAQGPRDILYARIDRRNVVALNADNGQGPEVIKPWDQRLDETVVYMLGLAPAVSIR